MKNTYYYKNKIGRLKVLKVNFNDVDEKGKCYSSIWDLTTGEFCGGCYSKKEDIRGFLEHYNVRVEF